MGFLKILPRWALVPGLLVFLSGFSQAHEEGAPFSGAIVEPLEVHHAHIEDEQRFNAFFRDGVTSEEQEKKSRDVFMNTYELAWASKDFRWGMEVFLPFSNEGQKDGNTVYGLGDIEIQPIKYAWVNEPETIFTTTLGITLPTGDEEEGLGEGDTRLEPHFFFDKAWENRYLGINLIPGFSVDGDNHADLEGGVVLSHSFIKDGGDSVVPPKPDQTWVAAVSLEILGETGLSGPHENEDIVSLLPGVHFWNPKSGWQLRFGIRFPVTDDRKEDAMFLAQLGNHFDWDKLFG